MKKWLNGKMVEMTAEEIAEIKALEEQIQPTDPLAKMAVAMSTATTLAQVRTAAKAFLEATQEEV